MSEEVNYELIKYIEKEVFPIYDTFDKGHDLNHIRAVIKRALELAKNIDGININILYASAALHDIGIQVKRKNHALYSGLFVEQNSELKRFFDSEEITMIKEAVEDHSTSKGIEPRSIYGKIVCDADKDDDLETSLLRAYEFTKKYFPDYSEEECIKNVFEQLQLKFGNNRKVKFWINNKKQKAFLNQMSQLANNEKEFNNIIKSIIDKNYSNLENKVV